MSGLVADLRAAPGLYRVGADVTVAAVCAQAEALGLRLFHLDGRDVADKPTLMRRLAETLEYPDEADEFGANWDALADVLTDLSWCPASGYVLLYDRSDVLARSQPEQWATAEEVFADAVAHWKHVGTPMSVVLRDGSRSDG